MSILIATVDKSTVNYETPFTCTIRVGLSELNEPIQSAHFTIFIPKQLTYLTSMIYDPIASITESTTTDGTTLTYTFSSIELTAAASSISIQCQYKFPASTSSTTLTTLLYINGGALPVAQSSTPPVALQLHSDFRVTKERITPVINVAPGGYVIWKLILSNHGDAGSGISNVSITDTMPTWVTLNPMWPIRGYDQSNNEFADTQFDGRLADTISSDYKDFTFTLPGEYTGTEYSIVIIGMVDANAAINSYTSTILWNATNTPMTTVGYSLAIVDPSYDFILSSTVPQFALVGNLYRATIYMENSGNMGFTNSLFLVDIPNEVTISYFKTGTFGMPTINYYPSIPYSITLIYTNDLLDTQTQIFDGFNTNVDSTIYSNQFVIPPGYLLTSITTTISSFLPGLKSSLPTVLYGTVTPTSTTTIQLHAQVSGLEGSVPFEIIANEQTSVNQNVTFSLKKEQSTRDTVTHRVSPHETIRYTGIINCVSSYIYQPILVEYLPPEVEYVGNEHYIYYNSFNDITYDSADSTTPFPLPILHPSEQVLLNGHKVVRFSYTGSNSYDLLQNDTLTIEFDVDVIDGASIPIAINNTMYLGNYGIDGVVGPNMQNFLDTALDMDGDTFFPENLAQSNTVTATIQTFPTLSIETLTKGSENTNFVNTSIPVGSRSGSPVTYRFVIQNNNYKDLYNLSLVDILPYINDTSILDPSIMRGSTFDVTYVSYQLSVTPVGSEETPLFTPYYCTGTNPIRFSSDMQVIGVDPWTETVTGPVKSIKFVQNATPFKRNQTITLDIVVSTPADKDPNLIAYNSIAIASSYLNDALVSLDNMPLEPYKKGVKGLGIQTILGLVFLDTLNTGIWNPQDPGINGVYISLHDATGEELETTFSYNHNGVDGYYKFAELPVGTYYVIFTLAGRTQKFTKQVLTSTFGSQPDSFGITPSIFINADTTEVPVYAGVIDTRTDLVFKMNNQARATLKSAIYSQLTLEMKLDSTLDLL